MKKTLIAALFSLTLISGACDLAKPQNPRSVSDVPETPATAPQSAPPAKAAVAEDAVDASIKLDGTFEDKEFGFSFSYPSSCTLDKGEGFVGSGNLYLWFSPKRKEFDTDAVMMIVKWMVDNHPKTRSEITKAVKDNGGTIKSFEKVNLDGKECSFVKIAFGGMMDPRGSRVSEQYLTTVKRGSDLSINFSGPAKEFEKYRPQFNAVLKSFKFDKETAESE